MTREAIMTQPFGNQLEMARCIVGVVGGPDSDILHISQEEVCRDFPEGVRIYFAGQILNICLENEHNVRSWHEGHPHSTKFLMAVVLELLQKLLNASEVAIMDNSSPVTQNPTAYAQAYRGLGTEYGDRYFDEFMTKVCEHHLDWLMTPDNWLTALYVYRSNIRMLQGDDIPVVVISGEQQPDESS